MENEAALIARARKGDAQAFEALVLRYKDRLYAIASGVCARMPSEAEDVTQETFISAMKNITSFKANAAFGTWLYRIAANNCWQRFRKAKTGPVGEIPDDTSKHHPAGNANDEVLKRDLSRAVSKALSALPEDYRMAITLCDIEGLPNARAAEKMKISLPALKSKLHRARAVLKKQLKEFQ
ncbi:MAG: sigma-70 family RNA polymerase sigma factor [Elusimicrobiaceae bacterium]